MGVQNLWMLLAPVGRQIEIESLAGQVLAVDASIWLTQFVKAMRDDEGNMIRNAHLMGTLYRVAKLLYYGVRPVFVFDGQTPAIKKRTTARRKTRQEQQSRNLRHTAQRILFNRLKQARQERKRNNGAAASAVAPGFTLPKVLKPANDEERKAQERETRDDETAKIKREEKRMQEGAAERMQEGAAEREEELTIDEMELDASRLAQIDLDAVFSLPPHLQKDMLQKIQRDRRQEVRNRFIPLAGNPEKYSQTQLAAFLQTSALNRRIAAAKRQKRCEAIRHEGRVSHGHRIDSNSTRFYIYETECERNEDKGEYSEVGKAARVWASTIETMEPLAQGNGGVEFDQKRLLSEPIGPKLHGAEVTAAWVARHQVRVHQEPVLAIEKLRQARLQGQATHSHIDSPSAVQSNEFAGCALPKLGNSIDPIDMVQLPNGMPVNQPTVDPFVVVDDESDEVEWEEVATEMESVNVKSFDDAGKPKSHEKMEWDHVPLASIIPPSNVTLGFEQVVPLNPHINTQDELSVNVQELDEDGNEELFLTLKQEMEDAKAHEELELVKADALQSALVTASNLTQWAAGAVRRALQAHSRQQQESVESDASRADDRLGLHSISNERSTETPLQTSVGQDVTPLRVSTPRANVNAMDHDLSYDAMAHLEPNHRQLQAARAEQEAQNADHIHVRYLQYSPSREAPQSNPADGLAMETEALQREQRELTKLRKRQLRDTDGITDDMIADVMVLLRLFGVPFLVSPMEAEAQCAALEHLGLVDGVITDDSDIFPFGGQRVYKNMFHHQKFVEAFAAQDIERELGFSREQLIALALLLGSDYTDGVRGIGIVNATEIVAVYPGIDGLCEFKDWVCAYDVAKEASSCAKTNQRNATTPTKDETLENPEDSARTRFQRAHATARRKWELGDEFPSQQVVQAYMAPQVDRSDARFSWAAPDVAALRTYCTHAFGWDQQKSDTVLKPLEAKVRAASRKDGRHVQTRLDRFFTGYTDQVYYAQITSKRLRSAVHVGTRSNRDQGKKGQQGRDT